MTYKFCENHLAELYEAVKHNDIEELEKIEHELSNQEECIACTYAFRAKGPAKGILLDFLKNEGFMFESPKDKTVFGHILYWGIRLVLFVMTFLITASSLKAVLATPLNIIFASIVSITISLLFIQFFD